MGQNYQKELEKHIEQFQKEAKVPTLLLHSCCAPCSSYCLEYLSQFFKITVFYYNPNIFPKEEYEKRIEEQRRLISEMKTKNPIALLGSEYEPDVFYQAVKGLEKEKEGGARCIECFRLRLNESARIAKEMGMDYFTTTLTISPLKNAEVLNTLGQEIGEQTGISWLPSDFKKKNGYKRSVELSEEHGLYRQDFCGCVYSKLEREGKTLE